VALGNSGSQHSRLGCTKEAGVNPIYENMGETIFARMSRLAAQYDSINLGQGFPDFGWPEQILETAARAVKDK
jgi:aspartate/methionine/tyrosine aminotransferase